MDQMPAGGTVPETDVGMLERMLGVLDWDTLYAPTAGTSAGHPDTAEQTQGTRSHPTGATAGHDRSQTSQEGGTEGHRTPRGTSSKAHKHGADGPNSEKMQQMRARHREAQARYRAKHREQKSELETDIKRFKNSIDGGAGELQRLKAQKSSLTQRLSNATAALQATLEICKLLPVGLSQESGSPTPFRLQGASSSLPPGPSRLPGGLAPMPIMHVTANPNGIFQPLHPPRPSLSSNTHHLPVSHEPILQASLAARNSGRSQRDAGGDQATLASSLQLPTTLSLSSSLPSTTSYIPPSTPTLRSLLHQLRRAEAARVDATPSEITWFAQMAVEVAPGTRLSFSSTLISPECVASNVLSGLLCRLEFSLAATLLRLQSGTGDAPPADATAARGEALEDSGAVSGRESPNNLALKRRRCDTTAPLTASGNISSSMSRSHGSHGSIPFAQADTPHSPYAHLIATGGPFSTGAGMPQSFGTSSAAAAAEAVATGGLSQRVQLQQRSRSLLLTKERMELMRVRCGVNGTHPMRAAVKAAYRTVVARYAAPGRLPMHEITRVIEKVLEKEEIVLRSLWEAQVERQGPGAAGEARSSDTGAASDAGAAADPLFWKLTGAAASSVAMGAASNRRGSGGGGLRADEDPGGWGPGRDEQAFYESSSEHMIAMLVSARAEMMRLVQELPVKASSEGASPAPVFDDALQDALLATATAQAVGSSLAITDATEVLLQLRIDSMLPLMSSLEFDTTHADLYKTLGLTEQQKRVLAEGWVRWEKGKQSLSSLSGQASNFLNSLPHEVTVPPVFLAHLSSLSTPPSQSSPSLAPGASGDASMPLSLALRQLPQTSAAEAAAAAAAATGSLPLWAATPASAMAPDLSQSSLGASMAAPSSRAPLLGGPSGQLGMTSDLQLQMLMQGHMQGTSAHHLPETLSPWPSLQLDDVCAAGQPGAGNLHGASTSRAGEHPFASVHGARGSSAHMRGMSAGPTHRSRMGMHASDDISMLASPGHCRCSKSLAPGCFARFSADASQLNSGMQFVGQCSGHMSCAAQAFQDLLSAHKAEKEHLVDALDLQVPNAVLTIPQVARVWSEHILEDSAPLDFLALCQLVSSQQHRQALFRHPFFHC